MRTIVNIASYMLYIIFFCLAWDKATLATNEFVEAIWFFNCITLFCVFSFHAKTDLTPGT